MSEEALVSAIRAQCLCSGGLIAILGAMQAVMSGQHPPEVVLALPKGEGKVQVVLALCCPASVLQFAAYGVLFAVGFACRYLH